MSDVLCEFGRGSIFRVDVEPSIYSIFKKKVRMRYFLKSPQNLCFSLNAKLWEEIQDGGQSLQRPIFGP